MTFLDFSVLIFPPISEDRPWVHSFPSLILQVHMTGALLSPVYQIKIIKQAYNAK